MTTVSHLAGKCIIIYPIAVGRLQILISSLYGIENGASNDAVIVAVVHMLINK